MRDRQTIHLARKVSPLSLQDFFQKAAVDSAEQYWPRSSNGWGPLSNQGPIGIAPLQKSRFSRRGSMKRPRSWVRRSARLPLRSVRWNVSRQNGLLKFCSSRQNRAGWRTRSSRSFSTQRSRVTRNRMKEAAKALARFPERMLSGFIEQDIAPDRPPSLCPGISQRAIREASSREPFSVGRLVRRMVSRS